LKAILAEALPMPDVAWEQSPQVTGGNLSYIHKELDGREVFFFGNSSETAVATHVRLRGRMQIECWDPHTGTIATPEFTHEPGRGQPVTRVKLALGPVRSCFLIGPHEQCRLSLRERTPFRGAKGDKTAGLFLDGS
jgi:hypothetical protein